MPLSDLRRERLDKLSQLQQRGLEPYPQPDLSAKDPIADAQKKLNQKTTVAGRLMSLRGHGKILFADLVDRTGKIQLFFQQKNLKTNFDLVRLFDLGDIISCSGPVIQTQAGETTIDVADFQILAKNIRPLPEKWHGLKDIEERYRQRYLDLIINPEVRQVFETRTKILSEMRHFLDSHGFMEVETPILQPIYGGASAKPFVTHHHELDADMYLRISDELYLKRLIVGGLEKVYEVSKDFRNESVSRFHNPEFTQIEFYWAYVDYDRLMKFTEELVSHVIQKVKNSSTLTFQGTTLDFTPPFKRVTFRDAILQKTAIDIDTIKTEKQFFETLKIRKLKIENSDLVGLGQLFDALYKEHVRPHLVGPVFITDYPASMIALAKKKSDNPEKIASFQLLACGTELLKAYNELNDPQDQAGRWREEEALSKKGSQTAMQFDDDYIRALEYGMPPTAGWGMGIDRFTQFLTDQSTIKDVILFPAMRSEKITANNFQKLIIGQTIAVSDHPNAKKLKIWQVSTGDQELNIVCSCTNLKVGDVVAVALPGCEVNSPNSSQVKIQKSKLRGVESEAMMCSPLELGVSDDHTQIYVFDPKLFTHLGEPVRDFLNNADSQN